LGYHCSDVRGNRSGVFPKMSEMYQGRPSRSGHKNCKFCGSKNTMYDIKGEVWSIYCFDCKKDFPALRKEDLEIQKARERKDWVGCE
jgi:hypothetical protein